MDVKIKGIDVSGWQGDINFKKVAQDNVDFVIVKAGYTTSTVDSWEKNYTNAKHNGLKVGAYWYSTATTIDEVMAEIKAFKKALKGKELDYPVYYDIEEQSTFAEGKAFVTKMVETFCEEMKKDKFYPGIYCSTYWYENYVEESTRKKHPAWIADYRGKCYYTGDIGIWQWGVGNVSGISGDVDMNTSYVDYSVEIKANGYNGFNKPIISEAKKTIEELAQEVLNGHWGAGQTRYDRLTAAGYNYQEVQDEVNRIVYGNVTKKKNLNELALEVIQGKWDCGDARYRKLTEAGYDYYAVQRKVNELLFNK